MLKETVSQLAVAFCVAFNFLLRALSLLFQACNYSLCTWRKSASINEGRSNLDNRGFSAGIDTLYFNTC